MSVRVWTGICIVLVFASVITYLGFSLARHGFSAKEKPSRLEEFLARHARRIATPANAKQLKNPYSLTAEGLNDVRQHWMEHCIVCHGSDGRGNTVVGHNLYPKAPDLRSPEVQALSAGELFYIISNGVRFTGMPAWGSEDSPEEIWQLVSFIRKLPLLTPAELELMEQSATEPPGATPGTETHAEHH
jgi:mono/diheme cytochrome c family protein